MNADDVFEIVDNDIIKTICHTFKLPPPEEDTFLYAAEGIQLKLHHVQEELKSGRKWQYQFKGQLVDVTQSDVDAYTHIFKSSTATAKLLKSFLENAKKNSTRPAIAAYLNIRRRIVPVLEAKLSRKKTHLNPFFDIWCLACKQLGFMGPLQVGGYDDPRKVHLTHSLLPIFMHHFGCAVPCWETLQLIELVAAHRLVLDVGCGNGYWTWILRNMGVQVEAVDDKSSSWRTMWIDDIVGADAVTYLKKRKSADEVLLLVYPIVGGNKLTQRILEAFKGDTVCYVGTQNANRYTAFADKTMMEYFEQRGGWQMVASSPMPSFPGKDDALQIFVRVTK
ncbi:hypothetical protein BCR37DRAFT_390352 [Protomyces lactucae-debilis]|uniref:Methyltransferase domain-containing protein n=1 Tax=Protomyces lactucae-debilis TaxID=2754530 RepID=A0A1Y2FWC4_PROLT|nr:uncharacterized protein BCR37DRAFT_390352 [Protomyces lactucae-debilis]ORY87837.1 hypothetical protein BCR37DRAFT_390352 [Protomyces lactucae-debilis]